ncbi:hypothetical protein [Paenibacillus sonchi]|uniref:hypothetical protein n=1 Tax=Paenibacillus sonchi TaxID=373687 RepID=UPI001E42100B|nr:hypothetical protein [Paenibacillus sonchi]
MGVQLEFGGVWRSTAGVRREYGVRWECRGVWRSAAGLRFSATGLRSTAAGVRRDCGEDCGRL